MKLFNKLFPLLPLMIATCSAVSNKEYIKIDYLTLEESQTGVTIKAGANILENYNRMTCISIAQNKDEEAIAIMVELKMRIERKDRRFDYSVFVDNANLGTHNTFTFSFDFGRTLPMVEETIIFNRGVSQNITIKESNNNKIMTTGYKRSNFMLDNPSETYTYEDQINFINYEETHVEKVYRHYDISPLKFKYQNGKDNILKGKFYFDFYDAFNLYPTFPARDVTMYRRLNLTPYLDDDGYYHFRFTSPLYYQPTTGEASLVPLDGYYPTSLLYFPQRYVDKLNDIDCILTLEIESEYPFTMTGKYNLKYEKKYFGECQDSAYCVEQALDYGLNVKEKIIAIDL